jgi:hypothetical protein
MSGDSMLARFKIPVIVEGVRPSGETRNIVARLLTEVEIETIDGHVDDHFEKAFWLDDGRETKDVFRRGDMFFSDIEPLFLDPDAPSRAVLSNLAAADASRFMADMLRADRTPFRHYMDVFTNVYATIRTPGSGVPSLSPKPSAALLKPNPSKIALREYAMSTATLNPERLTSAQQEQLEPWREAARLMAGNFVLVGGRLLTRCFEPALLVRDNGRIEIYDLRRYRRYADMLVDGRRGVLAPPKGDLDGVGFPVAEMEAALELSRKNIERIVGFPWQQNIRVAGSRAFAPLSGTEEFRELEFLRMVTCSLRVADALLSDAARDRRWPGYRSPLSELVTEVDSAMKLHRPEASNIASVMAKYSDLAAYLETERPSSGYSNTATMLEKLVDANRAYAERMDEMPISVPINAF